MEARIQRLEGEADLATRQLDEQRAAVRERITVVDRKIAEVQQKLDELNATAHRTGADLAVNQDRLVADVTRLRGELEEEAHRLEAIEKGLAQQKADTDARFAALKGAGALEEYEAKQKAKQLQRPTDKGEFFALAQQQENGGERAVARELYQEFVKKWPSDSRAADAHFRLGELSFGEKRYREALLEYGKVAQDFPRSDKAPDALFRAGESMLALDLRPDAKKLFEEVASRYPGTTAARRAKARLTELSSGKKGNSKKAR
jgi:tol-pal system protein YbgF